MLHQYRDAYRLPLSQIMAVIALRWVILFLLSLWDIETFESLNTGGTDGVANSLPAFRSPSAAAALALARLRGNGGRVSPARVPRLGLTKGFCEATPLHQSYFQPPRATDVHAGRRAPR